MLQDVPAPPDPYVNISASHAFATDAIQTEAIPNDPIPPDVPAVFSASTYFNNFSSQPFAAEVETTQGIFSTNPVSSAAHLFSPSDERLGSWNPTPFSNPVPMDPINNYGADGAAGVISYNQPAENPLPLFPEDLPKPPAPLEDLSKETHEEPLHNNPTNNFGDEPTEKKEAEVPVNGRSSTESIRQLTDQMSQLFDPSIQVDTQTNSAFLSSLETRNQELAAQLETERRSNQQLQFTLKESVSTRFKKNKKKSYFNSYKYFNRLLSFFVAISSFTLRVKSSRPSSSTRSRSS